ncbi:Protein FAM98A [Chionoecetes opilio]|uniref:Protein FAM98A n=1 Tax=Chionoecetes opilio TaxID=41210 RepID=A0A8J4YKM4_CHIOP|nr:Protein FAM98A [Chionoecetes opilio]
METDILDSLEDLGYSGELGEEGGLRKAVEGPDGGARCLGYTSLIAWVTGELRTLSSLEEMVNATTDVDEHSSFLMELSSFLKEIGCPHSQMTEGAVSQRLASPEDRLLLIDFLLGELMAARMISEAKPDSAMTVEMVGSSVYLACG